MLKYANIILITIIGSLQLCSACAQQFIGINVGYGKGSFINFSKDLDYNANYDLKSGTIFSVNLDTVIDSTSNIRISLAYNRQSANLEISNMAGRESFYNNSRFKFQSLNLDLNYLFQAFELKYFQLQLLAGPSFSYLINTNSKGNGWKYKQEIYTDLNGNPIYFITTENWVKDENNSNDLSKFNLGINIGCEFIISLDDRINFVIRNKYNLIFTNVSNIDNLKYTSFVTGYLSIGVRYKV